MGTDLVAITDADSLAHRDYVREIKKSFRSSDVAGAGGALESMPHTWITEARQIEYMLDERGPCRRGSDEEHPGPLGRGRDVP